LIDITLLYQRRFLTNSPININKKNKPYDDVRLILYNNLKFCLLHS
jgi:hypothetical protein